MATNALSKIRTRAKQIQKASGKKYQAALKQAGREYREGKVGKVSRKKAAPKKKTRARARIGTVPNMDVDMGAAKRMYKKGKQEQLAWALLTRDQEKTLRGKAKISKKIVQYRRELKALQ